METLNPNNPHYVERGKLGFVCNNAILWSDSSTVFWREYKGTISQGQFLLILSEPIYFQVTAYHQRWCYKVLFEEQVYWIAVDDILNPYYIGSTS